MEGGMKASASKRAGLKTTKKLVHVPTLIIIGHKGRGQELIGPPLRPGDWLGHVHKKSPMAKVASFTSAQLSILQKRTHGAEKKNKSRFRKYPVSTLD